MCNIYQANIDMALYIIILYNNYVQGFILHGLAKGAILAKAHFYRVIDWKALYILNTLNILNTSVAPGLS